MNNKIKVIENSILYTVSSLLVKAFGFFLIPIYTNYLTTEQYGVVNLVSSLTNVATFIIGFSLYSAIIRFYSDFNQDSNKLKTFYSTILLFIFSSGIGFFCLMFILKDILIKYVFIEFTYFPLLFVTSMSMLFISLHTVHQNILIVSQRGRKLTAVNLTTFFIQITLNLLFLVVFDLRELGIILSILLVNLGYFAYLVFDLASQKLIGFTFSFKILKESLRYSIPIMPHNLSTHIASLTSKLLINSNQSTSGVGLYSLGSQIGSVIDIVQVSVNKAFQPWFFESLQKKDTKLNQIVEFSYFLLAIYSIMYLAIGLFSQELIFIFSSKSYHVAWIVVPILVIGFSVKSIYYFYVNIMFYHKSASRVLFIATLIGSFADIFMAFLLVPRWGMIGSAISFVIAKIIIVSIVVFISKKYYDIGYRLSNMLKIIVPSLVIMWSGLFFSYTKYITQFSIWNFVYKVIIFMLYTLYLIIKYKKIIMAKLSKIRKKDGSNDVEKNI